MVFVLPSDAPDKSGNAGAALRASRISGSTTGAGRLGSPTTPALCLSAHVGNARYRSRRVSFRYACAIAKRRAAHEALNHCSRQHATQQARVSRRLSCLANAHPGTPSVIRVSSKREFYSASLAVRDSVQIAQPKQVPVAPVAGRAGKSPRYAPDSRSGCRNLNDGLHAVANPSPE